LCLVKDYGVSEDRVEERVEGGWNSETTEGDAAGREPRLCR
jgi:hypothetical protein